MPSNGTVFKQLKSKIPTLESSDVMIIKQKKENIPKLPEFVATLSITPKNNDKSQKTIQPKAKPLTPRSNSRIDFAQNVKRRLSDQTLVADPNDNKTFKSNEPRVCCIIII